MTVTCIKSCKPVPKALGINTVVFTHAVTAGHNWQTGYCQLLPYLLMLNTPRESHTFVHTTI